MHSHIDRHSVLHFLASMPSLCAAVISAAALSLVGASNATVTNTQAEIATLKEQLKDEMTSRKVDEAASVAAIANVTQEMRLLSSAEAELVLVGPKLEDTERELAETRVQIQHLKWALGHAGSGPVTAWLISAPLQQAIALLALLLGLLAALGPDGLVTAFNSIFGACITGLLIAGSCSFMAAQFHGENSNWLDANCGLLNGEGGLAGYVLWAAVTGGSLIRWRSKIPFVFFANVDNLHLTADGQRPLMANDHETGNRFPPPPPPPPRGPPPGR
eukprot:TRINITY_DN74544_c0_g1_i1.p1 TRINITY_DN74544_c0_g1~~TRINITY_DN74544_c0_g1_i1.p1  ORF type:complete len:274 (+),score=45.73 TRINITY_DN74544_c0_g1_i1:99-920(+)